MHKFFARLTKPTIASAIVIALLLGGVAAISAPFIFWVKSENGQKVRVAVPSTAAPVKPGTIVPPPPPPSGPTVYEWQPIAPVGTDFTLTATTQVRYGWGAQGYTLMGWIYKTLPAGNYTCGPGTMGGEPFNGAQYYKTVCQVQLSAPNVVQTGGAPVINTALFPAKARGYNTSRVRLRSPPAAQGDDDVGSFRPNLGFSHLAFDDPVVYPGQPGASHLHTFVGHNYIDAFTTAANIRSTCLSATGDGGTANCTGYWFPTMINLKNGAPIIPMENIFYYKSGYKGTPPATIQPFPVGLRMIAGTAANTAPFPAGEHFQFSCDSYGGGADGTPRSYIPNCRVGDMLILIIYFPQCWDGVNLDSPNHKSHMAYAVAPTGCPSTHPVPLTEISLNIHYPVTETGINVNWKLSSDNYASSGSNHGYSIHADWFNGWDDDIQRAFIAGCVAASKFCNRELGDGRELY